MSLNEQSRKSVLEQQTKYVDSNGNSVDLSQAIWMAKVNLPSIDMQGIYRKIQDEVVFLLAL